jgi:hypothetical protein
VLAVAVAYAHLFAQPRVSESPAITPARSADPVRVSIATSQCAGEEAFWGALARRSTRIRRAAAGEAAPVVVIEIVREAGRMVGRMRVSDGDGGATADAGATRTVTGASCDDVVAAMSLMTALVFDPDATSTSPPVPSVTQPVPQPDANVGSTTAGAPGQPSWSWSAAADGHLLFSSYGTAWGGGAFGEAQLVSRERRLGAWLPALRVGATFSTLDVTVSPARATVAWGGVQVDACPWRAAFSSWWTLRPCASAEAGVLDVSADGVDNARSLLRPWVAAAVRLRSTWTAGDRVEIGLEASSLFPLLRDDFEVAPSLSLFRAPAAALGAGISVGMRIL